MRKMKTIMGALLAIFVLNACDNEVPEQNNDPLSKDGRVYNFNVEDYEWENETGSRTNLSASGAFSWAEGDTIGIMPDEGSQVYFVISSEDAGKSSASFSGGAWALKAGNKYAAYYPFVEDILLDKTKVPVDYTGQVAAGQTMNNAGAYDFLATTASEANETGGLNFSFSRLGTPVRLKFTLPAPCEVKQIVLTAQSEVFPLTAYMDLTQEQIALTWGKEDLSRTFYIGVEDLATTQEDQEVVVYFMMPPVDLSGVSTLTMTVMLEEGENVLYSLEGKKLTAGRGSSWTASPYQQYYGDYCYLNSSLQNNLKEKIEEFGSTKLKFVSYSTVTAEEQYWGNAPFYFVKNGEWLEIHTPAKKFMPYNGALQFNSNNYFKYALLKEIDLSDVDFSQLQNMSNMFYKCMSLEKITFPKDINTPNLIYMYQMFYECPELTSLDLSGFNTEKVLQMEYMFSDCSKLASITFGEGFKTDNVQWIYGMFYNCSSLESLDLSSFNTENVTNMSSMFYNCSSLESLDLSSFNTENVTNMSSMFSNCSSLESLDLSSFNTENVTNMSSMFSNCSSLESLDLSSFNTENVTNMSSMFSNCSSLESLDLSSFNTEMVTNMNSMFSGCSKLASLTFGNGFKTDAVQYMNGMFSNCSSLESLDLSSFNTEKVTSMSSMFYDCSSLESLDLSSFNTEKVTSMSSMFYDCSKLATIIFGDGFKTDAVQYMSSMFYNCSSLESLDLSSFNTAKVLNMSSMFYGCSSLTSLDLDEFDTSLVQSMQYMFRDCSALTSLDLSSFDTGNVTNMWSMFQNCSSLTSLDLSHFNTSKVTDMDHMFELCSSLEELDLSNFQTDKVYYMNNMFYDCKKLTSLDLSSFTFASNVSWMFFNTGADCADKPIDILVSEEGKAYLESKLELIKIDSDYATLVVKAN